MRYNPFRPQSIISPGMFAGRVDELKTLEQGLFQTKNGNPQHFLIHGERGIGKSSLMLYVDNLARGAVQAYYKNTFKFIALRIELEPGSSYQSIIDKVGHELTRELRKTEKHRNVLKDAWDFLKRWEVLGVKYTSESREGLQALDDLADSLREVDERLKDSIDGIVILIDEADKPGPGAGLGRFVKLLSERLARRGESRVCVCLAGISGIIQKLRKSHESSVRAFHVLELKPLNTHEREDVVMMGLEEARRRNGRETRITSAALEWICTFSEGYPHFIQQYAYSAFDADGNDEIGEEDVLEGAKKENGALHQLGVNYFEAMYWDEIKSDKYRQVLRVMSAQSDNYVTREHIKRETGLTEYHVNNALMALKNKGIVIRSRGKKGEYRLPTKSFAVWIRASTQAGTEST